MALETKTTNDLIRIAAAGGGLRFNGGVRTTDELIRIAAAASGHGSRIFLSGMGARTTDDLIRISAAGEGAIVFE